MKDRILIFADHFLPGYRAGGPILSLSLLYQNLVERFDLVVATRNRDFQATEPYVGVAWDRETEYLGYSVHYFSRIGWLPVLRTIRRIRPKTIYLNSFFSVFTRRVLIMRKLGLVTSKVVLAPRGELSVGALAIKSAKKRLYLNLFKALRLYRGVVFHATDASEQSDISALFPVETNLLPNFSREVRAEEFPLAAKDRGFLRLIFLSRVTEKKNLLQALTVLAEGRLRGDIKFDVYGPIEDRSYWDACMRKCADLPPNVVFAYAGPVESKDVLAVLSRYHALFLPTRNENFGHVIVEAMKLGLLPILSDQTPWRGLIESDAGWDLPLGDNAPFAAAIQKATDMDQQEFLRTTEQVRRYIRQATENSGDKEKYRQLFQGGSLEASGGNQGREKAPLIIGG